MLSSTFRTTTSPAGGCRSVEIERAAENARRLLEHYRSTGQPTFHIQHTWEDASAPFFVAGTPGAAIHESVAPRAGRAGRGKAFPEQLPRVAACLEELRRVGADGLTICGAMSHMCIDATTRAAADLGFNCLVAHDACATRDVEFEGKKVAAGDVHAAYMSALGFAYAKVMPTADALKSLS